MLTACSKNFTVAALEVHAGDGDITINLLTHKHSQRYFTECDSPVSPSSSSVSGGDIKDESLASTPDHVARLTLPDADEVAKLLFTMHEVSSDWSHGTGGSVPASSPVAAAPLATAPAAASPASPAWLRAQLSLGACLYHKQQSAVPGQVRDGTTRAIVDIPLPPAWLKRLHTCLDSRTLSNLELRDRRKHALGLYTLEALSAAGVSVSFHPLDALHTPLSPQLFDLVRGKAGREPTLLMYLSHEDVNLSLHLYRGNLPLSRDVRAVHRVPSGVIVLRVCLWDMYEAYSVPFEVKAKQHDGDIVHAVSMNNFTEIGTGSEPAARTGAPGPLKRRRNASPPHRFQDALSFEQ